MRLVWSLKMPPKKNTRKKTAKSKSKSVKTKASNGGRELRPKKGTNYKQLSEGDKPAKEHPKTARTVKSKVVEEDAVSLTPNSSDDDLDNDTDRNTGSNTSNSATPESGEMDSSESPKGDGSEGKSNSTQPKESGNAEDLSKQVKQMVGDCLRKMRGERSKNKKKRSRKRRRRDYSSESSGSSETETESSETTSDYDSDSSGSSRHKRSHKRKRMSHKRSTRKRKKGKLPRSTDKGTEVGESPSQSTIYTRGCKSPQVGMITASSDTDSQRSGHIDTDANSDEFISSIETSFDGSHSVSGRRRSRDDSRDSPTRRKEDSRGQQEGADRSDEIAKEREARARDRADEVIRDIQRNKADLAKPSGEWERELQTLLIDMKHFHLTSHVDRKLKATILDGDFTIDFRKLIPQSRSRSKVDPRLQMVNQEGVSYLVPADRDNYKDITSYKQWEIAFKVFMGIYLEKWESRTNELLQYSHIIQTAAMNHPWENVYNYDIAIREIMTDNPGRLWGTICQLTWSLEMGEPVNKHPSQTTGPTGVSQQSSGQKFGRKICWRFNKGRCTFGSNCEYDHRCAVCGSRSHGRHSCYKRGKGQDHSKSQRDVKREK